MPPKKPSKPSNLQAVSSYDLRKVHIPYVCEDGTSSYQPRSAPKKAVILQESLLTLAKQKQQERQQAEHRTRSTGPTTSVPPIPKRPKQQAQPKRQALPPPTKLQKAQVISQNVVSQATQQQRIGAHQRAPIQQLVMEEDSNDSGNGEKGEEDENEDLRLTRDVLETFDKFKNHRIQQVLQVAANGIRSAYPDDLTTSDIQDHLKDIVEDAQSQVDYPIEIYTKIYINKTLVRRKSLPDTTRDNFNLSDIEDKLAQDLDILENGEPISVLQRTVFVHAAIRKTAQKVHDLDDFGLVEAGRILKMVEATREQHPRSKISLTIEIRASIAILPRKSQPPKRRAPEADEEASSPMQSSPPVI
ncbi:hypothetical protein FGG08_007044 [Glutinoglossum americanum]|uniref:Uncharacterized protein n=1 Tax=Glutinoglossum americanum TaxID=1670608 RepID=A0A9P8I287_9PEZI|nr:hypothetical protein FGG08_007044 [Glutinoglossum americanum]